MKIKEQIAIIKSR